MTAKLKVLSIILIALASMLLVILIVDVKLIFTVEVGLFDNMPSAFRTILFISYPIILLTSYILFLTTRQTKTRLDKFANILFLANGFFILLLLIAAIMETMKSL